MIPSLSWKNIWRNKVRSLVVITAMTIGIFGGLFTWALTLGMTERRVKEALSNEVAHIQIHDPGFIEDPEIGLTLPDPEGMVRFAETQPGVRAATARLKIVAMINSPSASSGVTVYGIDPLQEKRISGLYAAVYDSVTLVDKLKLSDPADISTWLKDSTGTWFDGAQRNPVVIGETLARKLKVRINSKIVLTFQSAAGNLTGGSYRVCGIYRIDNNAFEETNIYVRKPDLAGLADLSPGDAHEIAVFLDEPAVLDETVRALALHYPGTDVMSWKKLLPDVAMLNDLVEVSMFVMMLIILGALGFGIVNTMLMVVLERVRELGMLMAIGMNKRKVFIMIIQESVLLCLTGAVAGMAIGALVIRLVSRNGIDLSAFAQEGMGAWGFNAILYPSLPWGYYLLVAALVVITGIAASAYPAWKAMKLNPADALRSE